MKISKVQASSGNGDAIHIESATHLWIDHNDLSSDTTPRHGLLRRSARHHPRGRLHHGVVEPAARPRQGARWSATATATPPRTPGTCGSRTTTTCSATATRATPSVRFGTGHVYNNYFVNGDTGVHSRGNAQMLVQNNVFAEREHADRDHRATATSTGSSTSPATTSAAASTKSPRPAPSPARRTPSPSPRPRPSSAW